MSKKDLGDFLMERRTTKSFGYNENILLHLFLPANGIGFDFRD